MKIYRLTESLHVLLIWYGPRQANLVLIAYASSEGSGEPAHPRGLARTFAARSYKQWVKRNLQTEMDGWVRVLHPFNSISVISRRWEDEHERLCAMKGCLGSGRISPPAGFEPATPSSEVGSANRSATETFFQTESQDPWPLWMAGHAQLKFVMMECSKTQIRLTGPICKCMKMLLNRKSNYNKLWCPKAKFVHFIIFFPQKNNIGCY